MSAGTLRGIDPVDDELARRLQRVTAHARALLELPPADPDRLDGATDVRALIEQLAARLEDAAAVVQYTDEHETALARLCQRYEARFDALARVQAAVALMREVTAPNAMLARAPAALCGGSRFERAIVSLVRGGRMIAEAAHFNADAAGARTAVQQLQATPLRLEHPLIETELLRRRRATIVPDAAVSPRVDPHLVAIMGAQAYAAAPIVAGSQVVGVIHAGRGAGRALDVLDRDVLWEFATGLAQAFESASLRRTLRRERERMRQFLEWLGARSGELTDAHITLERSRRSPLTPGGWGPGGWGPDSDAPPPPEGRDERAVFEGLLTKRELEVLRLLAEGHTNKSIADTLVISGGTVKFHVNSILRKLRAANRAEAVSRYLRLLGMRTP
ncbi:MAG TPA: LuxR C-terminal-related transcriptional regulator [Solirubrobacteraceae bacterium]|nr:LuxR C-terminal-related transcriptional regulator [Solirubrobacteraceae bacterium]